MNLNKNLTNPGNPFEALAQAIVKQAVNDYRNARRSKNTAVEKEIEDFLKSDYFYLLMNLDGDILIREMRRRFV